MDSPTNKKLQTAGKRPLSVSSSDNEVTNEMTDLCASDAWPRFLVMESVDEEKTLARLSPFVIGKAMKGICDVVDVKKLRSGALLIEVSRPAQATNLLKQTTFAMIPIKVTPHRTMNSCKGVIRDRDLAEMDLVELVSELKCVGVTDARNIMQNRNGTKTKTATIILTFARAILPKSINAGYSKIRENRTYRTHLGASHAKGLVTINLHVNAIKSVPDVVSQNMAQTPLALLLHTVLIVMVTTLHMQHPALSGRRKKKYAELKYCKS